MCELQQIFGQLQRVSGAPASGVGAYPNGAQRRSQVQEFADRLLVDLECRAEAFRGDPGGDFGAAYWFHLGGWVRAWVGRH